MKMIKKPVYFYPKQVDYIQEKAIDLGISFNDMLRKIIDEKRQEEQSS